MELDDLVYIPPESENDFWWFTSLKKHNKNQ